MNKAAHNLVEKWTKDKIHTLFSFIIQVIVGHLSAHLLALLPCLRI